MFFFFCPRILPPHSPSSLWCLVVTRSIPEKSAFALSTLVVCRLRQILLLCGSDHRNTTKHAVIESPSRAAQGNPAAGNLRRGSARLVADSPVGKEAQGELDSVTGRSRSGTKTPTRIEILRAFLNNRLIAALLPLEQPSSPSPATKPRTRRVSMTSRRTRTWWIW